MGNDPKVLIFDRDPDPLLQRLRVAMPDIVAESCDSYEALPEALATFRPEVLYSITFAGRAGYPRDAVFGAHGPRWIAVGGSGVDHLETWDPEAVTVTNAAGSAASAMAEYVFGTVLHFTLDIAGTMLIVGLGHTGQAVAQRAKAFGMHVIGTRSRPQAMPHVDAVHAAEALPDLWGAADVVVLSVPLLDSTRGLVDARALAAMKRSAILVDVSRGGVVEQNAMINALRNGTIAAAALDVFEEEPLPQDSPIWELPNLILSPHSSSVYADWAMQSFELFLDNLGHWRRGEALFNVVDPARGY